MSKLNKYWAAMSKEERSQKMRELVLRRHSSTTKKERHDHAVRMASLRWHKK